VIVLVIGGTRSGKSEVAERLARELGEPVTYIATAGNATDADFAERIARHRERRPSTWTTIEASTELPDTLTSINGTVLVDSLGAWVAGADGFKVDVDGFCRNARQRAGATVVVSEEVGMSVHSPTELGRAFADALGDCNRAVADVASRVLLVVAGRILELGDV
jgi:adenosyl cobinamide kinase/adenosyl cobinamide phosphate guanylyltransferase